MSFGKRKPTAYLGVERRRAAREQVDVGAYIALHDGRTVSCSLVDYSFLGARLAVASAFGLPETFELRVAGRRFHATIVRRGKGHVGVRLS
jgi:hypothetical protein